MLSKKADGSQRALAPSTDARDLLGEMKGRKIRAEKKKTNTNRREYSGGDNVQEPRWKSWRTEKEKYENRKRKQMRKTKKIKWIEQI